MVFKTYKMNDMKGKQGLVCMGLLLVLSSCSCHTGKQITASGLQRKDFQTEVNGQHTDLFTLSNKQGMEVCITNYGARVVSILVPDEMENGRMWCADFPRLLNIWSNGRILVLRWGVI